MKLSPKKEPIDEEEPEEPKLKNVDSCKKRVRKLQIHWTNQQTLRLIQEVKAREGTWNFATKQYKNRNERVSLWQEVADAMELSRQEVSLKWNSLRCSFRVMYNKLACTTSGQRGRKQTEVSPLYSALKFLEPIFQSGGHTTSNSKCSYSGDTSDSMSNAGSNLDFDDDDSRPTQTSSKSSAKRRCIKQNDEEQHALNTVAKHDTWDDLGNFVATNGREWAAENLKLAKKFKTDIYELVLNYQKQMT